MMNKRTTTHCIRTIPALVTVLFALFCMLLPSTAAAAPGSADVRMQVSAGYNGTAILGSYNPFRVELENKGAGFSGELQVITGGTQEGQIINAVTFDLPKGSAKELTVNVPIQTVNKNIVIKIIAGKKTVKNETIKLSKIISPQTPVIAILSDDPNSVTGLSGLRLTENLNLMLTDPQRVKMMASSGSAYPGAVSSVAISNNPSEVIYLDSVTMPSDARSLQGFAVIIISGFDTTALSDKQTDALASWVSSKGMLLVGTGAAWKRTVTGLPDSLKPFTVTGISTITPSSGQLPAAKIDIATVEIGKNRAALEENGVPLAVYCPIGQGSVTLLTFDPSTTPISGWTGAQTLWNTIISKIADFTYPAVSQINQGGYYAPNGPDLTYLASNVPESQTPPYGSLLIIIAAYILIAGPLMYLILKWKDKRDWSWVAIPAAALLFTAVIYGAGFKTRFQSAVVNNISIITLDTDSQTMEVSTSSAAFNNTGKTLTIEYPKDLELNVLPNYIGYSYYGGMPQAANRILYKHTEAEIPSYEIYNARLWEPKIIQMEKTTPLKGGVVEWAYMRDGRVKARIDNKSGYRMTNAFIIMGSSYIMIGDILPGEQKDIDMALSDKAVYNGIPQLLNSIYDDKWYNSNSNRPADWRDRQRQRELVSGFIQNYTSNPQYEKLAFCAINNSDPGYGLKVNGKVPKIYNSNFVYQALGLQLKKGERVDIPAGFITPVLSNAANGVEYIRDGFIQGLIFRLSQDADFTFTLPDTIQPEKLSINIAGPVMPYGGYPPGTTQKISNSPNKYSYFIFNNATGLWDKTSDQYVLKDNPEDYMDAGRQIKIRVSAEIIENRQMGKSDEMICFPELEISGVVK